MKALIFIPDSGEFNPTVIGNLMLQAAAQGGITAGIVELQNPVLQQSDDVFDLMVNRPAIEEKKTRAGKGHGIRQQLRDWLVGQENLIYISVNEVAESDQFKHYNKFTIYKTLRRYAADGFLNQINPDLHYTAWEDADFEITRVKIKEFAKYNAADLIPTNNEVIHNNWIG